MIDFLKIHALVDGELAPDEQAEVEKLIASDPAWQKEYAAVRDLKASVNSMTPKQSCEKTWKMCVGRLNEFDKSRKIESIVGRYAWALCAVFFVFILAGGFANRFSNGSHIRTSEVAQMASGLSLMPFGQGQAENIQQRVSSQVGRMPMNITSEQVRLLDAADGLVNGHYMARLNIADPYGKLALIVMGGPVTLEGVQRISSDSRYFAGRIDNLNCVAWGDGNLVLLLIGDRSHDDLCSLADTIFIK